MNLDYKNYHHISFDLWLTLIRSNPEFKAHRNQLFKDFFEIDLPIEKVSEKIRYYDVVCNNINERSGLNIETHEIYCFILASLGVDLNALDTQKLDAFYNETEQLFLKYKPVLIYPEIRNLLATAQSENVSLNILSNTAFIKGYTLKKLIEYYELHPYFAFQIYSDECGFSKPNKMIFDLIQKEIPHIEKSRILHVGDNEIADYNGAIAYGFHAHLIKP